MGGNQRTVVASLKPLRTESSGFGPEAPLLLGLLPCTNRCFLASGKEPQFPGGLAWQNHVLSICDKVFVSGEQLSIRGWPVGAVAPAGHLMALSSPAFLEEDLGSTKASTCYCLQHKADKCGWRAFCSGDGNGVLMGRGSQNPEGQPHRQGLSKSGTSLFLCHPSLRPYGLHPITLGTALRPHR